MAENNNKGSREFSLSTLAVDNGTSIFILTLMILIFGVFSYQATPKEQYPEVDWPTVYINTPYFGNSAADIENLVTRPIEKQLQSVDGIKDIKSTSIQDYSVITAEFESGLDIDDVVRKVKDAVDLAKGELPNDLDQEPTVLDINLSEIPIVTINVSGEYTNDELRKFAEVLQDDIEDLDEINSVELKGAMEREVKVDVDLLKMESMQVSFRDIENAIAMENMTMSGGELVNNDFRRAIRIVGEFQNVREMEDMIIKSENQRPIYLKDVANVTFGFKDRTSIARSDALPVISLDVIKKAGKNLLDASDKIKVIVEDAKVALPDDLKISLFNDQSVNTRDQVSNLENSIISGVLLVVIVLLFFLGMRNALFVGLAIPLSMLMGIMFLYISGVTMNIVVLFALILALGLLVDNAIVVVENIYRYIQEGYSPMEAAKYGAGEVALPIIASTITTLAAFIPLAFWPGIMGSFMQYFPITLIVVLTSSLFVALVINTVITSRFMKVDERAEDLSIRRRKRRNILIGVAAMITFAFIFHLVGVLWMRNLLGIVAIITIVNFFLLRPAAFWFQNKFLSILESGYDRFIRAALNIPGAIFLGTFVLLFAAIGLFSVFPPKIILFPSADPLYVNAFVELPMGKDIEATNRIMNEMEQKVQEAIQPYEGIVEAVLSQIGENTSDPNGPPEPGSSPNKARLTVSFVPTQEREGISTFEVMERIRGAVTGFPGAKISIAKNVDGPATGKPINIELQGENIDVLAELSEGVITYLDSKNVPGVEQLQADVKIGKPEMIVNVDRDAARRYEISTYDIANAIRTSVFGKEISKYKEGEDEYPIFLRLDEKYRYDIDNILNQKITFRNPANGRIAQVPISSVANVEYTSTYSSVKRKNLERVITVYSNVLDGFNANEVNAELASLLDAYPFPDGYKFEFTGEQQQQAEDMSFLLGAFGIAIFAIFIILVAQFNSLSAPVIIALSILFSTIGVFLGYTLTGRDVSVIFSGVGIVSLAGVVVNNAIVLIDYINILLKRRREELGVDNTTDLAKVDIKEAIIKGGATRLRPVLLTAITTVLGLIPLAIGFNINFFTIISDLDPNIFIGGDNTAVWGPMAWTVIYGLIFATFLTLIVVPVMFWLAFRLKIALKGAFNSSANNVKQSTITH